MKTPTIVGELSPNIIGVGSTEVLSSEDFAVKRRTPKLLFFDIETAPNKAYVWGKWQQNVIEFDSEWYMLSWSAKWVGGKHETKCLADYPGYVPSTEDDGLLVKDLWDLFNQADVLIAHNGNKFDIKRAKTRFIEHGLLPPEPSKTIDTLTVARKHFSFNSNKLDDLGRRLGVGRKMKTGGFELWRACMEGDLKAWALMKKYNKQDVLLLERVYEKMKPWIDNHAHMGVLSNIENGCRNCGGTHFNRHGYNITPTGKQPRYQCQKCGAWQHGKHQKVTDIR